MAWARVRTAAVGCGCGSWSAFGSGAHGAGLRPGGVAKGAVGTGPLSNGGHTEMTKARRERGAVVLADQKMGVGGKAVEVVLVLV